MDNSANMLQLCRLCLVKDEVNIPIFEEQGDIRQIFQKISSCLPVKVSQDDKLPKKICDGCSYKLDMCYEFWNTSANTEKQLLSWLSNLDVSEKLNDVQTPAGPQPAKPTDTDTIVKQEEIDPSDVQKEEEDDEEKGYMFQQNLEENNAGPSAAAAVAETNEDEPPPKRQRRTAAVKAAIAMDNDSDDDDDSGEPITKMEDESEDSDGDDNEPSYADVPSTSADDQPGPSGVGKDGADAPYNNIKIEDESETDASKYSPKPRTRKGRGKKAIGGKTKVSTEKKTSKKYVHKLKPNQKARSWCCKICFEEFATRKYLEGHRRTFHEDNEYVLFNEDEIKYSFDEIHEFYTCNNCSAEFQTKDEVEKHVETHEEKYECQVCCDVVHGALNFSSHMQLHREDKNYPCPLCPHIASRKSAMLTHISRLHFRKYDFQCRTCGKCFNDATTFKEHESFHLGVKPFNCLVCGKEFVYSRYLIAHQIRNHRVRVLDKDSKTQCHMCTKIFARSETLVKHMLTKHLTYHEGPHEKKHLCDVCGQGFSRTDKLKIHYRKHTGEKPYSCVYCSKSFIKRDYLIMHERIHNGEKPYVCDYCGKSFNQGAPLRIHMRSHTGERPYKCPHCQTGCVSKGALNAHIKSCLNSF